MPIIYIKKQEAKNFRDECVRQGVKHSVGPVSNFPTDLKDKTKRIITWKFVIENQQDLNLLKLLYASSIFKPIE